MRWKFQTSAGVFVWQVWRDPSFDEEPDIALEPTVTLCIAATCQHHGKPRIVLCSDLRLQTSTDSAEIQDKLSFRIPNWPALLAGQPARAEELLDTYRQFFKNNNELKGSTIIDTFKKPAHLFQQKLLDELTQSKLGMGHADFLNIDPDRLREDTRLATVNRELQNLRFSCQLLIAGFLKNDPYIFFVQDNAIVTYNEHWKAIGTGAATATSVLMRRKQHSDLTLTETLYHLYEARRLADNAPGVGRKYTYLDVLRPKDKEVGVKIQTVNKKGEAYLKTLFQKFGPQPVDTNKLMLDKMIQR